MAQCLHSIIPITNYFAHLTQNKMAEQNLFKFTKEEFKKLEDESTNFLSQPFLLDLYEIKSGDVHPAKHIKYFQELSEYPIDLNLENIKPSSDRFEDYIEDELLALKYAMSPKLEYLDNIDQTKVYTRAGTLALIMRTPYIFKADKYFSWTICASRYKDALYLQKKPSVTEFTENPVHGHHSNLNAMVFSDFAKSSNFNCDDNENNQLIGIFQSELGNYDFLYSTEICGIKSNEEIQDFDDLSSLRDCPLVLVKQIRKHLKYSREKMLRFWLQSYLSAVDDLYIGYKDNHGRIEEPLKQVKVSKIPMNYKFKPNVCCGFLHSFLEMIESVMENINSLDTTYEFCFNPIDRQITYKIFEGKTEHSFINAEYKDFMKSKQT